jgi:LDH2 family malate/lactate/ureidoglycolate dehydrogenase
MQSENGKEIVHVERAELENFCQHIFAAHGLSAADAAIAAEVLVAADARGIPSHGTARLPIYINGLESGLMVPDAEAEIIRETPSSIVVDAHGAMGAPVSMRTMRSVIEKARGGDTTGGAAFGTVRDSNHFGIAGYYAMMALEADTLGFAMTNTAPLGVPTFGRQVMFGTNPIAFAAPADAEGAFVLDMATTVVPRGKIEVYDREGRTLPEGWAVDKTGRSATEPASLLEDMTNRVGGGLLPLGGKGELFSGYKGYGLAVMVDILCGVLSGGDFGTDLYDTEDSAARVSHFFGAISIDRFRDPADFRRDMDTMLQRLREAPPAADAERVYFAGQKEFEQEAAAAAHGVALAGQTYATLGTIAEEHGVPAPSQT